MLKCMVRVGRPASRHRRAGAVGRCRIRCAALASRMPPRLLTGLRAGLPDKRAGSAACTVSFAASIGIGAAPLAACRCSCCASRRIHSPQLLQSELLIAAQKSGLFPRRVRTMYSGFRVACSALAGVNASAFRVRVAAGSRAVSSDDAGLPLLASSLQQETRHAAPLAARGRMALVSIARNWQLELRMKSA